MARSGIWVDYEILESKEYYFSIYAVDSSTILRDDLQGELGESLIVIDTIPTIKYEMQRNSYARIKGILIYDQQKKEEQERFVLNIILLTFLFLTIIFTCMIIRMYLHASMY